MAIHLTNPRIIKIILLASNRITQINNTQQASPDIKIPTGVATGVATSMAQIEERPALGLVLAIRQQQAPVVDQPSPRNIQISLGPRHQELVAVDQRPKGLATR